MVKTHKKTVPGGHQKLVKKWIGGSKSFTELGISAEGSFFGPLYKGAILVHGFEQLDVHPQHGIAIGTTHGQISFQELFGGAIGGSALNQGTMFAAFVSPFTLLNGIGFAAFLELEKGTKERGMIGGLVAWRLRGWGWFPLPPQKKKQSTNPIQTTKACLSDCLRIGV